MKFKRGDQVRVQKGPYTGLYGRVLWIDNERDPWLTSLGVRPAKGGAPVSVFGKFCRKV